MAGAHATIVRTTPADGAVRARRSPREVQLRWSEPVDLGPGSVRLLDATRQEIKTADGHATSAAIATTAVLALPSGLDERDLRGRLAGDVGRLAPGLGRVLVLDRRAERAGHGGRAGLVEHGRSRSLDGDRPRRGVPRASRWRSAARASCCSLWPEGPRQRARAAVPAGRARRADAGGTVAVLLLQGPYATGGSLLDAFKPSLLSFTLSTRFGQALLARHRC